MVSRKHASWRSQEAYTDALLDEIVLIALQLGLQPLRLGLDLLGGTIHPVRVEHGVWIVRRHGSKGLDGGVVAADIATSFGFVDGGAEGVDGEVGRGAADEEEALEACAAWVMHVVSFCPFALF